MTSRQSPRQAAAADRFRPEDNDWEDSRDRDRHDRYRHETHCFLECTLIRTVDGQLTLENGPIPPPSKKSDFLIALEHSQVAHSVMKRLFPNWWLDGSIQVQDGERGLEVACAMLHELEELTKTLGPRLIVFVEYHDGSFSSTAVEGKVSRVLNCLSDPATRVFDLNPALSELKAKDVSRYSGLNMPPQRWAHMTAEGNRVVALEILKILTHGSTQVDRGVLSPTY